MKAAHSLLLLAAPLLLLRAAADDGFGRYQVILQRMPFGDAPPPTALVEPPPTPPSESFAKNLRICSITQPDGQPIKVGLVDTQSKSSFVLSVGEEEEGISLVSADLEQEEAVLRRGAEIVLIKLAEGQGQSLNQQQLAQRLDAGRTRNQAASYQERRRQRREERLAEARKLAEQRLAARREREQRQAAVQPRYTGEELRKHLQEYNLEVIRQGLPPLPLELTPEQDATLVAEGILPPNPNNDQPRTTGAVPFPTLAPPPGLDELPVDQMTEEELMLIEGLLQQRIP
jgi:hypothetical protein